jgi:ligand-binding SRPBCC domain-containing protein
MRHTFDSEQWLPHPVELVFSFFSNPENLPRLMPPWQKARIEEASFAPPPPPPAGMQLPRGAVIAGSGTRLTLSFRPIPFSPVRVPWDAEIVDFLWNQQFCDIQHRGPFASWKHCHRVRPEARVLGAQHPDQLTPGTLLHDHVDYEAPLGPLGDLANILVLKRQLASTFRFRHRRTLDLLARATSRT